MKLKYIQGEGKILKRKHKNQKVIFVDSIEKKMAYLKKTNYINYLKYNTVNSILKT